jgi:hypothetical protein
VIVYFWGKQNYEAHTHLLRIFSRDPAESTSILS